MIRQAEAIDQMAFVAAKIGVGDGLFNECGHLLGNVFPLLGLGFVVDDVEQIVEVVPAMLRII